MTDATQTDGGPAMPADVLFELNDGDIRLSSLGDGEIAINCDVYSGGPPTVYPNTDQAREIGHALIKMADELDALLAARQEAPDG